tara:strand:- start:8998 stop:9642 length:645 start_codon:yes stop_codon:yes gene_type:complete
MQIAAVKSKSAEKNELVKSGFSLVELVIIVGMISTLSGLILPSALNWVRVERVNSYTRELREYLRIVRLESRRWGSSCFINVNHIDYNSIPKGKDYYGYSVNCSESNSKENENDVPSNIDSLIPAINNSIFQVVNKNFQVTPNGRISSEESIVIVIGSRFHSNGPKILNCLIVKSPTGQIVKGKFYSNHWISSNMPVSQINEEDIISASNCIGS